MNANKISRNNIGLQNSAFVPGVIPPPLPTTPPGEDGKKTEERRWVLIRHQGSE